MSVTRRPLTSHQSPPRPVPCTFHGPGIHPERRVHSSVHSERPCSAERLLPGGAPEGTTVSVMQVALQTLPCRTGQVTQPGVQWLKSKLSLFAVAICSWSLRDPGKGVPVLTPRHSHHSSVVLSTTCGHVNDVSPAAPATLQFKSRWVAVSCPSPGDDAPPRAGR